MTDRPTTEKALSELLRKFRTDWTSFNDAVIGFPVPLQPGELSQERFDFRLSFLKEELRELRDSHARSDLDGQVDALIDLIYVAVGTLGEMGVTVQPTWDEVQRANMKKRRGEKATRAGSEGYDAVKPEGWTGPNHIPYLSITSEDVGTLLLLKQPRETGEPVTGVTLDGRTHWYNLTSEELRLLSIAKDGGTTLVEAADAEALRRAMKSFPHLSQLEWTALHRLSDKLDALVAQEPKPSNTQQLTLAFDASPVREAFNDGFELLKGLPWRTAGALGARKPRLLILGHGRHGKDTVCEMLASDYDLKFTSSSWFCAERVIMPKLVELDGAQGAPAPYADVEACYADRHNHRALWYDVIRDFNRPDATALGRAIFAENDVYCGLRSKAELNALKNAGVYDVAVWVDASDRLPPEGTDSCTVEPWMADFVLDNNGSLEDLKLNLSQLMENLL